MMASGWLYAVGLLPILLPVHCSLSSEWECFCTEDEELVPVYEAPGSDVLGIATSAQCLLGVLEDEWVRLNDTDVYIPVSAATVTNASDCDINQMITLRLVQDIPEATSTIDNTIFKTDNERSESTIRNTHEQITYHRHARDVNSRQTTAIDGGWSVWGSWQACSSPHSMDANSFRVRYRVCNNPPPSNGGKNCTGTSYSLTLCNVYTTLPPGGVWKEWGEWSKCFGGYNCSVKGSVFRMRTCSSTTCAGDDYELKPCQNLACNTGIWGEWDAWSQCYGDDDCNTTTGTSFRYRSCPDFSCGQGHTFERQGCLKNICAPVDGHWSDWSSFSSCSVTCGSGNTTRLRTCDDPPPIFNGSDCVGKSVEVLSCNTAKCPEWSSWISASCSATCGTGSQLRVRHCSSGHNEDCPGSNRDMAQCFMAHCPVNGAWSEWLEWGQCDVTCASGHKSRVRTCTNPRPEYGGLSCSGHNTQTDKCTLGDCPTWSEWYGGMCPVTCGGGTADRLRFCSTGHDEDCSGSPFSSLSCNTTPC